MGLKLKIFIGYAMLILLLGFIIYLFRGEREKRDTLNREMQELGAVRDLTRKAYSHLLELASQGEVASIWNENDLKIYREKREKTCDILKELRKFIRMPEQQARIDSVCLLLEQKETLLSAAMQTFDELGEIGEQVDEKLPAIVRQVRRISVKEISGTPMEGDTAGTDGLKKEPPGEKQSFWKSLFSKTEKKSFYRQQREQKQRQKTIDTRLSAKSNEGDNAAVRLLHSLSHEVTARQTQQRNRLFFQMDSLYADSRMLNVRLNTLASDFERIADKRLTAGYTAMAVDREKSFDIVTILSLIMFVLAIVLYVIIHKDVNRRSRYEKELEISARKNRELMQSRKNMMLGIAHDLRSPLSVIKESAELLPKIEEKSGRDKYARNIRHSSDYMLSLVNTLMEFYSLDAGQFKLHECIFSLADLFHEVADNYRLLSKKKRLTLSTRFSGLDAVVSGDRAHLQQIVNNLLSNALKFTVQGSVLLETEYQDEKLCLRVRDTGPGMTGEEKERIFNAFERLDNAHGIPGFGLGLTITRQLVSQMKGIISVESRPGEGSSFTVFLPVPAADGNSRMDERMPVTGQCPENIRVLVIDDDLIQQRITRRMLLQSGVACDCCTHSWELTGQLKDKDYDVLLADIQMPEMDGFGVLEMLRSSNIEKAKTIPVIAVSARDDNENEYLSAGFAGSIHKPFTEEALMGVILKVTNRKNREVRVPDFSVILSGEEDEKGMLRLFITEMKKDLASLSAAFEQNNRETVREILHKNLPLWETVRLDYPIARLRILVTTNTTGWTDTQYTEIQDIIRSAERLIDYAEKKLQEIKE